METESLRRISTYIRPSQSITTKGCLETQLGNGLTLRETSRYPASLTSCRVGWLWNEWQWRMGGSQ